MFESSAGPELSVCLLQGNTSKAAVFVILPNVDVSRPGTAAKVVLCEGSSPQRRPGVEGLASDVEGLASDVEGLHK